MQRRRPLRHLTTSPAPIPVPLQRQPPTIAWTSTEPAEPGPVTKTDEWSSDAAAASERTPVAHDVALIAHDVAPVAHHVASVAPEGTPSPTPEMVVADDTATAAIVETAPAPEQSTRVLLEFIDQVPGLSDEVRETARMKISTPDLTFAAIAEQTGGVATSTALRRYKKAEEAALKLASPCRRCLTWAKVPSVANTSKNASW